jgi:hypothetical protein
MKHSLGTDGSADPNCTVLDKDSSVINAMTQLRTKWVYNGGVFEAKKMVTPTPVPPRWLRRNTDAFSQCAFETGRCKPGMEKWKFRIKTQPGGTMMKRLFAGLCALVLLSISLGAPVQAQTAAAGTRTAGPFSYDVSHEVTLLGTVSSVLTRPSPGMIMGSHLLLATPSGPVDASLAHFRLQGKGALSVAAGQQIEVTGVMKTIMERQVFLVRTVKVGSEVYTIRNEHGFPVSPQARERANGTTAQKGETL